MKYQITTQVVSRLRRAGSNLDRVKIVVIAWNEFAKRVGHNQQQTQGVKNFKWQLGAAQAALQLLQRALFVAHSLYTSQWIHNAAN